MAVIHHESHCVEKTLLFDNAGAYTHIELYPDSDTSIKLTKLLAAYNSLAKLIRHDILNARARIESHNMIVTISCEMQNLLLVSPHIDHVADRLQGLTSTVLEHLWDIGCCVISSDTCVFVVDAISQEELHDLNVSIDAKPLQLICNQWI